MSAFDHVPVETLADHAEDLLSEFESRRVTRHLRACAACRDIAESLLSVSRILSAADPGVMPAWYVTRLNADLARLAVAEPVAPSLRTAPPLRLAPIGSQDAACGSGGRTPVAVARRVSSAAAAVLLLVGGTTFGIRTIGEGGHDPGRPAAQHSAGPVAAYTAAAGLPVPPMADPARTPAPRSGPNRARPAITRSGATYDEDNFAAGVVALLRRDAASAPAASASDDLSAEVVRCAARLHRKAITADEGFWRHRRALVLVVASDSPDQVTGYVFYGRCDGRGSITPRESPWAQQVDKPAAGRPN